MPTKKTTASLELSTISLAKAVEVIQAAPRNIPIMMWGDTGIGKTAVVEQVARRMRVKCLTTIAQVTTPVDWSGLPHLETINGVKYTRFSQPLHLPQADVHGEEGIFFFDELPNATKAVQAAIQSLLTQGSYNGYEWPEGWRQVVAGNEMSHRANTYEMPRPVANRLMHIKVGYDVDAWQGWAAGSAAMEEAVEEGRSFPVVKRDKNAARVHSLVRSFLRVNPQAFGPVEGDTSHAFPTPRSWDHVSQVMELGLPDDLNVIMFGGLVGPGAAAQFFAFLKDTSILPDPRDLLTGKAKLEKTKTDGRAQTFLVSSTGKIRLEASQLYAVACSIAGAVKGEKELVKFFECLEQFPTDEYGIVAVNEVRLRLPEVAMSPAFHGWAEKAAKTLIRTTDR